jgi:uncharacterized membrane protein
MAPVVSAKKRQAQEQASNAREDLQWKLRTESTLEDLKKKMDQISSHLLIPPPAPTVQVPVQLQEKIDALGKKK